MNVAVLASGNGSNFEAIIKAVKVKRLRNVVIKLLVTDREDAYVRIRARRYKIKEVFMNPSHYRAAHFFDRAILALFKKEKIQLVVLAGYMRILSKKFVQTYRQRILNIHPSLLPAFKGTDAIRRAVAYGVKVTGVTVHFVDEKIDHGPILAQGVITLKPQESLEHIEKRIHRLEHKLYPEVIQRVVNGTYRIKGRMAIVKRGVDKGKLFILI